MLEERDRTIRIQSIDEKIVNVLRFNASPVGDCQAVVGITDESELFIEIYKPLSEGNYEVCRIIFDAVTTRKIRRIFRREQQ